MNKFNIGDTVHCFRHTDSPFNFTGVVLSFAEVDYGTFEYSVTNAPEIIPGFPILIWESEMEKEELS